MAQYTVTDEELQELNELINRAGGENTSKINERHEQVVAVANTLPGSVGAQRSKIIKLTQSAEGYNGNVGQCLSQMQTWHDDVKGTGGQEPPEQPPEQPGPGPGPAPGATPVTPTELGGGLYALPTLTPSTGNYTFVMDVGKRYTVQLAADGSNTSYSCPSGPCHCAAGAAPGGTEIVGQPGNDNAVILGKLAGGKYFTMWLGDGHTPQGTCLYSAQKYAT